MLRLSVGDLETLRYFKDNEDGTLEDLVERLMRRSPPTANMLAGQAFAKFMETAKEGSVSTATVDGWTFDFECDVSIALPAAREVKAEVVFDTPSGPVTLVGVADGLNGIQIRDQKLTETIDAERYTGSLQWRSYLSMFGAREFVYDLFRAKYERGPCGKDADGKYVKGEPTGRIAVLEYHPLRFYAYPNMRADVERAVCELAEVVKTYVPQKITAAAAAEGASL